MFSGRIRTEKPQGLPCGKSLVAFLVIAVGVLGFAIYRLEGKKQVPVKPAEVAPTQEQEHPKAEVPVLKAQPKLETPKKVESPKTVIVPPPELKIKQGHVIKR